VSIKNSVRFIRLSGYFWPVALKTRIENESAGVIHIPFKKEPIKAAVNYFDQKTFPKGGALGWYTKESYDAWNIK